jgi:hypothetical protein
MSYVAALGGLVKEGLELSGGSGDAGALRLRELGSYCSFIEKEFPGFVAHWEKTWEEEQKT